MNPRSLDVWATRSKCNLALGDWKVSSHTKILSDYHDQDALRDAEHVLEKDPVFVKAIYGKAESLFNLCQFEHALVQYCQGQVG